MLANYFNALLSNIKRFWKSWPEHPDLEVIRNRFEAFEKTENPHHPDTITFQIAYIKRELHSLKKTVSALDRTGQSSDSQMEERLQKMEERFKLRHHQRISMLPDNKNNPS
ncbi:MAG: hypothetical protein CO093_08650 [Alphaproteobacteria bacterium CG_4_9_14_3_um_filter_47_13]|nr:MAG: hypothetical protein CO093_08650 [Alphaproteobacteria bacterium CG_4_9_14_3_um_filter_47_13]